LVFSAFHEENRMTFRLLIRFFLAAAFVASTGTILCQTVYDGEQGGLPLAFGGGLSNFDPDFTQGPPPVNTIYIGTGYGRMWGATGWAETGLRFGPAFLHPFNLEVEYRSIFSGGTAGQSHLVQNNYGGGVTYAWKHFRNFRPYGKYIASFGTATFAPVKEGSHPNYAQDSRFTNNLGAGLDYRVTGHIWVRADYEYQLWGNIFGPPEFSPQGFTIGAMYHLNRAVLGR